MSDWQDLDAVGLAADVRAGRLSARESVETAIQRIEQLDPRLNVMVGQRFEEALGDVDRGLPDGPLTGVPTLVKSLGADVAGLPTTRGSRLFADRVAAADSELVRRYRASGMVVLGTTNTPELGLNASTESALHGPALNPWRETHSTGGSSGGSAAAVASAMVPVAHANDGGGSIRIPASMCGLFGLKPSRGRISPAPYPATLAAITSHQHAVTRTVRDSALLLDVSAGPLAGDAYGIASPASTFSDAVDRDPGRLRVGLMTSLTNGPDTHLDCVAAAELGARLLESLGHEVVVLRPSWDSAAVQASSGVLMGSAVVAAVDERLGELGRDLRDDDLEPFTRLLLDHYRTVSGADVVRALQGAQAIGWQIGRLFDEVDVLLTPTLCRPTPELGYLDTQDPAAMYERAIQYSGWTSTFNVTGMPAMSLPLAQDAAGLPLGVQVVADHAREELLLSLAGQVEAAAPWQRIAPLA
ncbi:amidase [Nocardioides piscis]|uniref:Amidase n=1 Tax=Nocardioides piscis TaxID=2714938 RepID=A0A6G7YHM1_9ACTN|nr:amidase family protein [Nocardioides piscis]QIK76166.1 amidase [Nocardioides piscis]